MKVEISKIKNIAITKKGNYTMKARILKYLNEEMTQEEGSFFEHELKRDHLMYLIEKYDVLETGAQKKAKLFSFKQKILMAAGFVLLIGLSVIYSSKYSGNLNDKIFAAYYEPYKTNIRLSRLLQDNDFSLAFRMYNEGNYRGAIKLLREINKADSANISAYFLIGVSLMETQNYEEAIKKLSYAVNRDDCIREQTEWYMALCYLKIKQKDKAILLLNDLATQYSYQNKAVDILKKIK
jgi:tetratricopeptide (TPR) repeat protein